MKEFFQGFFIVSLIFPSFIHPMEMPSLESDPEFLEQYNQILNEYKKIEKTLKDLAKAEMDLSKGQLSVEKLLEFIDLQRMQITSLINKITSLLENYSDALNEEQKNKLRELRRSLISWFQLLHFKFMELM